MASTCRLAYQDRMLWHSEQDPWHFHLKASYEMYVASIMMASTGCTWKSIYACWPGLKSASICMHAQWPLSYTAEPQHMQKAYAECSETSHELEGVVVQWIVLAEPVCLAQWVNIHGWLGLVECTAELDGDGPAVRIISLLPACKQSTRACMSPAGSHSESYYAVYGWLHGLKVQVVNCHEVHIMCSRWQTLLQEVLATA